MYTPTCPICDRPVADDSDAIEFGAVGGTEDHAFYGATAHRSCLKTWVGRDDFVRFWNESLSRNPQGGKVRLVIAESDDVEYEFGEMPFSNENP